MNRRERQALALKGFVSGLFKGRTKQKRVAHYEHEANKARSSGNRKPKGER